MRITILLLLMLLAGSIISSANIVHQQSSIYVFKTFYLHVKTGGWLTNLGGKPIRVNETDLLVFDYPLNISDQKVLGVKAYVDNMAMNYTIIYGEGSATLIIENKSVEESFIDVNESIDAWVEYNISIDMASRLRPVWSLLKSYIDGKSVSDIISMSGSWSDIRRNVVDEKYYRSTKLWNKSNPLINLLVKYLNSTSRRDKPLSYVLSIINWIDKNIIYSTRIPPRQPWEVIVEGAGDCDDKSNLLVTLLRANGIPSYLEIGLLFLSNSFRFEDTEVNGLIHYKFIGGGGHGWVVAYIPPWGWIRIDLTASINPGIGRITTASYYVRPIVVMSHVYGGDYASQSAQFTEKVKEIRLKYDILVEMKEYNP